MKLNISFFYGDGSPFNFKKAKIKLKEFEKKDKFYSLAILISRFISHLKYMALTNIGSILSSFFFTREDRNENNESSDEKKLKEENKNNIKKFEEYLKILEKRISFVNNEITIIYKIKENEKFVKIFGDDFVKAKKDFCKILYEGKEYELVKDFNVENINSELLEIKLKIVKKIVSFYGMFYQCSSLLYVPDISKFDTSNIVSMNDMFCDCSSLLFLPDISKWNTSNAIKLDYMFKNCKSLLYLPNISKWNIKNVQSKKNMFKGCDESLIIPKIFK